MDRFLPDPAPCYEPLQDEVTAEFAVIGGGYTGLSAALTLAEAGADVVLLDAQRPGWGLRGAMAGWCRLAVRSWRMMPSCAATDRRMRNSFFAAERAAVDLVETYVEAVGAGGGSPLARVYICGASSRPSDGAA
ncbi:FAD-dependent oxidoreductase [Phaeobacter inhibens]|uniref:FAD-dependent oxidoreductase n=1 Tax=Phaeobacter inhibens TaxID=221822 RepID=UPI0021A9702C|nr:FAD-dependent oxidoreductase [Phaeobacter inhibens]